MILQKILGQGGPGPQGPRPPGSAGDEPKMFDTQSAQHFYSERNLKRTYLCFDTNLASAGGISRQTFVNFFASEPRRFSSRVKRQPRLFPTTDGKSTKQQRRITQQRTRLSLCVFGAAHSANITNWCIHIHGCVNSVKQLQAAMHQWIQKQSWSVFFLSDHKKKKKFWITHLQGSGVWRETTRHCARTEWKRRGRGEQIRHTRGRARCASQDARPAQGQKTFGTGKYILCTVQLSEVCFALLCVAVLVIFVQHMQMASLENKQNMQFLFFFSTARSSN